MEKSFVSHYLKAALFMIPALGLLLYGTWCGIGLTYDSHDYLAAAKSFLANGQLLNSAGDAYLFHAPLFPVFISFFGGDVIVKMKYINILMFLVSYAVICITNYRIYTNSWLVSFSILSIGLSVGQQMVYNFLWSEPLFIFFFAFHNFFLVRFLKSKKANSLAGMILFAFLTGLTRNAGFFIILSTTLILIVFLSDKKRETFIYFILSSLGFAIWNIHVMLAQNGIEAVYSSNLFFTNIFSNTVHYLEIISLWFLPSIVPFILRIIILISAAFYLLYLLRYTVFPKVAKIYFIQSIVYLLIMFVLLKVDFDEIERLLAVIYPWVMLTIFMAIDLLWIKANSNAKKIIVAFILVWMIYTGIRSINNAILWHHGQCEISAVVINGMNSD